MTHIFMAPYQHKSVFTGVLSSNIGGLDQGIMIYLGRIMDHLHEKVVKPMNETTHNVIRFSPIEIWGGTKERRHKGFDGQSQEHANRNQRREFSLSDFTKNEMFLSRILSLILIG